MGVEGEGGGRKPAFSVVEKSVNLISIKVTLKNKWVDMVIHLPRVGLWPRGALR